MPILVDCTSPGLEDNFIAITERWTRGDLAALFAPGGLAELFPRKVTTCCLECVGRSPLTDPAQVYGEDGALHPDLDVRLINFVSDAMMLAVNEIAGLGKANARLSSGGTERATTTMPPVMKTETTAAA